VLRLLRAGITLREPAEEYAMHIPHFFKRVYYLLFSAVPKDFSQGFGLPLAPHFLPPVTAVCSELKTIQ